MIPLFDLSRQYKSVKDELDRTVKKVLISGQYILGNEVKSFEEEFAKYLRVKYAIGVASGTDALKIAIKSLGLTKDNEVILPANVYPTAFGVAESGVKIKLVDVDLETYNIDPSKIESAISERTRAIIPVHLYGQICDMEKINTIAKKYKLFVIEDCAQAHGGEFRGKKLGTLGDVGCFSFYPTKPLGCYGDGGMIVTNNFSIYQKAKLLRMYGETERYRSEILGYNSRLDEIQAAILRVKLKYLDRWNSERKKMARLYKKNLAGIKGIVLPQEKFDHVFHLFVIKTLFREKLKEWLMDSGIITGVHYPTPIHLVRSSSYLGYKKGDFPIAEKLSQEILSLPLYIGIKSKEVFKVVNKIKEFYEKKT